MWRIFSCIYPLNTALNAGWDTEALTAELRRLQELEFDLDLIGFDSDELAQLLEPEQVEGLTDEDDVPDVPETPVTVQGDIWVLGNHRLMCGDSTNIDAIERLIDGREIDFLFTSPPYNAGKSEKLSGNTHTTDNKYASYKDDKNQSDYLNFLREFTNAWMWVSKCMAINIQQLAGNKIAFVEYLLSPRRPSA